MPIDRDLLIISAAVIWLLLCPTHAQAQFGAPVIVSDPPVETSVKTPGGAGLFEPQAAYLNSLMQILGTGVSDASAFAALYAGWIDFGPDAADIAAQITNSTMTTYANAITVARSQAADFQAEDAKFAALESCNASAGALGVLAAIQCSNEIALANAQQTQLLRQLEATRLIVEAVHYGEELNEKSQYGANMQTTLLNAAQH